MTSYFFFLFRIANNFDQERTAMTAMGWKGYIITLNSTRYKRTTEVLSKFPIRPFRLDPVSYTSHVVQWNAETSGAQSERLQRTLSNKFTHRTALLTIAHDNSLTHNDWALVFEDDIGISEGIDPKTFTLLLQEAFLLGSEVGFVYLGLCAPTCGTEVHNIKNITIQHCVGACAHAYAVQKRRAMWIFDEMVGRSPINRNHTDFFYFDVQMLYGFRALPEDMRPLLVGSNVHQQGTVEGHFGIVYQDRERFPSALDTI